MLNNHGNRSYGMRSGILFRKLFCPTERKKNYSDRENLLKIRGLRPRICKNFEITRAIYSNSD